MREFDPGHVYGLAVLDGNPGDSHLLTFVKRKGDKYPGNTYFHPGTQLQECWRAEIARLTYLQGQHPCRENEICITYLRQCIFLLEKRAAERHGWEFPADIPVEIELLSTCSACGHVYCKTAH